MFLYGTVKSVEGRERVIRRCSFILNLMAAVCLAGFMLSNTGAERERIYQDAIKARNSKIAETRKALEFQKTPDIWFLYEPLWICPDIELVGKFHDGVKWVCGLRRLRRGCIVYSFGSNGDDQFESDILKKTFCKVFTFDPTMSLEQEKMLSPGVLRNFHKIGLAKYDGMMEIGSTEREVRSLKRIMKDLKHKRIDILKVDIEGAEYDVFEEFSSSGFPDIGQILVEVHAFKDFSRIK